MSASRDVSPLQSPLQLGRSGVIAASGLAAALVLAWLLAGDAAAVRVMPADPEAMDLLRETAAAERRTPYEGTQFRTTWHATGAMTSTVRVAHPTAAPVTRGASALDGPSTAPSGWLAGFTPAMLDLLARNYAVVRAADGIICGRKARIVEARRANGATAGRFWIDAGTGLMLHRELLDEKGRTVSATGYNELRIAQPRVQAPGGWAVQAAPWPDELAGGELAALRERGWPIRDRLPGGFRLTDARQDEAPAGPTVHLNYSDGLIAVSVFVQRGTLNARRLGGWQRIGEGAGAVFRRESRQRWAVWASQGYVYTVLTDAPTGTSNSLVAALPHGDRGVWARMGRGLARLGSWANPWN